MSDMFGDLFGKGTPKPEKRSIVNGKRIAGELYLNAEEVIKLLDLNGVLPEAAAEFKRRLRPR